MSDISLVPSGRRRCQLRWSVVTARRSPHALVDLAEVLDVLAHLVAGGVAVAVLDGPQDRAVVVVEPPGEAVGHPLATQPGLLDGEHGLRRDADQGVATAVEDRGVEL